MDFKVWLESMHTVHRAERLMRTGNALFHASHTGNLKSIKQNGLVPQHGEISRSTDAFQCATTGIDRWGNEICGEEPMPVTFLGEDPLYVKWQIANKLKRGFSGMHDITPEEIEKHGVVTVVRKNNRHVRNYDEKDPDMPPHVEPPDHFAYEEIYPKIILTGKDLLTFLRRNYPEYMEKDRRQHVQRF